MTDVRSLLASERASRRIQHPNASYTESGKLLCNVCAVQIKRESLWDSHIESPQHNLLAQKAREASTQSKKRKAGDSDDQGRKRVKGVPDDFFEEPGPEPDATQGDEGPQKSEDAMLEDVSAPLEATTLSPQPPAPAPNPEVDEAEWAAFERDMAAMEQPPPATITASATISAAPMTAEEIAAQAREEQSTQRGRRDAEIEAEKEDAEQALQDEFDEMDELEDRLRKLREKREALRKNTNGHDEELLPDRLEPPSIAPPAPVELSPLAEEDDEEDADEDEEDDFDDWKFGAN